MGSERRVRIGVFGGTFNPIHNAHLLIATETARAFNLDRLLFVPVGQPSHKQPRDVAPAAHRYAMARLAVASHPLFAVSSVDLRRPGPTYSVDTLHHLHHENSREVEWYFITGADTLAQVPTWRQGRILHELAHFVGSSRAGHDLVNPGLPAGRFSQLQIPHMGISSTTVRDSVRAGALIDGLVPEGVLAYIRRHGLYRTGTWDVR